MYKDLLQINRKKSKQLGFKNWPMVKIGKSQKEKKNEHQIRVLEVEREAGGLNPSGNTRNLNSKRVLFLPTQKYFYNGNTQS